MLEGRTREVAWLGDRIRGLREGAAFAAVVRGEAGVGKSALIDAALLDEPAYGTRVLRARGYESDSEIPYAGLLELATPLLDLRETLPQAQRAAISSAFALEPPTPHDRLAVAAGLLGLLAQAAEREPLLAVVDDVHWLDDASRDAILFAARRLVSGGVGMVLAARDGAAPELDLGGVRELRLNGLELPDALKLLRRGAPKLPASVAESIVVATAGNPLALVELPGALTPAQLAGEAPLADPLPASAAIERAFSRQVAELPPDTRRALLVAAALHRGRLDLLTAALRRLELPEDVLAPAEQARIVAERDGDLLFRHPLLRAAVYHAAASSERRVAHAALGAVATDPRVRAWHLAHAASGADETVAAALEEAAHDARARNGHAEAARAFERAAQLSTDSVAQGRRALDAAQEHAVAGHVGSALALLDEAEPRVEPALAPAVARLRGNLAMRRGEPLAAQRILEGEAERALAVGDHASAATLLLESSISYTMTGDHAGMFAVLERASTSAAVAGGPAELITRIMLAVSRSVAGGARQGAAQELAVIEPLLTDFDPTGLGEPLGLYAQASMWRDPDRAARVLDWLIGRYRDASAFGALPFPLTVRAMLHERRGRWTEAEADAEEAVRLAREIDQATIFGFCLSTLALVEAGLGRVEDARAHAREGLELTDAAHARNLGIYLLAALGRAELADDRPEAAAAALDHAAERAQELNWREPSVVQFSGDHIEALVRIGREADARTALERLAADAELTGGPWGNAVLERGRMLLAPADELDAHAQAALRWHELDGGPFDRARTELAWGERLRRRRRRMDAREPLERALQTFRALGAEPWARRAADELAAAGGTRPSEGAPRTRDELSAHELKVALMVAHGMTNREVAAALFLSPKTIERHLSRIYRKLDVRSRTELARLLAADT
ncbi:AAA family ATPase [Conexibacter stalactiti]|uniref:LuxR C-terminal-related transcriptional regulator n=1 Tax=Conexibacter stalactiti TaxID=1940611 RepID=A0ABU4HTR6_9ACTN|nr:AAA family ATPase [Conexibacter stalactiti]MDW5596062.1 LuxR C-terminal-related transcriptional regulator [Conexibacter stalactiti]MEC5036704.1 AAA family ATPase [Conexibacter stalactiti]